MCNDLHTLDSESTESCDHIKGATKHSVVGFGGIILPDGCRRFDSCDLCYMLHNVNVAEIDNVRQAAVGGSSNIRKLGRSHIR